MKLLYVRVDEKESAVDGEIFYFVPESDEEKQFLGRMKSLGLNEGKTVELAVYESSETHGALSLKVEFPLGEPW